MYLLKIQSCLSDKFPGMDIKRSISGWNSNRGANLSKVRKVICASGCAVLMVFRGDVARTMSPMELNLMTSIFFWSKFIMII